MRVEDLTVEVRDKTLARLGTITPDYLDASFTIVDSAVGEWRLTLPMEHPMAAHLRTPGAGIIVALHGETVFSGPMTKATSSTTWEDQRGVLVVEGVSDEIVLWDTLAWPDPDFDWSDYTMDVAFDEFTGLPWDAMEYFIDANLGRFDVGSLGSFLTVDLSAVSSDGLVTFRHSDYDTSDATSYTFSDVNLGPESEDRTIVVCAMTRANTGSVIDDITLNGNTGIESLPGNPADLDFGAGAGGSGRSGKWVRFAAPTGTTGTIVVPIHSGTAALCGIMVWSSSAALDHDPEDSDHSDSGQLGWVGGVTLPAGAVALAAHYWETTEETTWPAGFTDDALVEIGDGRDAQMAGAHTEQTGYVEVDNTGTYTNALGSMIVYTVTP